MAAADELKDGDAAGWRHRAVSKSLKAARTRAEQRVQRFLDAAFALIDERGTSEVTIQEGVAPATRGPRRESRGDLRSAVESESNPLERLRAFTIRLHEWCEPLGKRRKRGAHNRVPISEFSLQVAIKDPERLTAAMAPISRVLIELLDAAVAAGSLRPTETGRAALLIQQTVMYGWLMNRFVQNPRARVTSEDAWKFCLHGLAG